MEEKKPLHAKSYIDAMNRGVDLASAQPYKKKFDLVISSDEWKKAGFKRKPSADGMGLGRNR